MANYGTPERPYSNSGSPFETNYVAKLDPDGTINLKADGVINLYERIQSHKESCSIELALKRFALGDDSALQVTQGAYGDFTTFPKTFAEVLQVMINSEEYFNQLPPDVRRNFDFDFNKFLSALDDPISMAGKLGFDLHKDFGATMDLKPVANPVPEVPADES